MEYEELNSFLKKVRYKIGEDGFFSILLKELYNIFYAKEIYLFVIEDGKIVCNKFENSEFKTFAYRPNFFEKDFEISLDYLKDQKEGILEPQSTGIYQKFLLFNVENTQYLLILRRLKESEYLLHLNFIFELLSLVISSHHAIKTLKEEKYEKLQDVLSVVAHEIKNPLAAIRAGIETLTSVELSEEDKNKILQTINATIIELSEEIDNICCRKFDAKSNLKFSLRELIEEVVEEIRPLALAKKIEINKELEDVEFTGNMSAIKRAILNILINAIKYNRENGKVFITLKEEGRSISIKVKDTGIGIPEELKEKIFDKFVRGNHEEISGSGLGLYIAKNIIEAHKGKIIVNSKLGEGTEFTIILQKGLNFQFKPLMFFMMGFILVMLLTTIFYPILPYKPTALTNESYLVLKTNLNSTITISKDAIYTASFRTTLFHNKERVNITLKDGEVIASLTKTDMKLATPYGQFSNLGTKFSLFTKEFTGVSVFNGAIASNSQKINEGSGAIVKDSIKIVPLLDAVKGITYETLKDQELRISWEEIKEAKSYEVWIAKDTEFTQIVKVVKTDKNSVQLTIPEDGIFYVKIYAIDRYGLRGMEAFSEVKNFYHLMKGIALRESGSYSDAINEFEKSFEDFKGVEHTPISEIAWTYYIQGNLSMAENKFKEALSIAKTHEDMVRLARIYFLENKLEDAKKLYLEVLQENSKNLDAMWGLAECYLKERNISLAESYLDKVEAFDFKYPLLHYSKAKLYLLKGEKDKALNEINLELKYYPDSKEAKELLKEMKP